MKYTNKEVTEMYEALALVRRSDMAFPAKISYAIVRNLRTLGPIYEDIMGARAEIIQQNGDVVEDHYTVHKDKMDSVNKELKSLSEVENEVHLTKIRMRDIESIDIPIDIMEGLYAMIDES